VTVVQNITLLHSRKAQKSHSLQFLHDLTAEPRQMFQPTSWTLPVGRVKGKADHGTCYERHSPS